MALQLLAGDGAGSGGNDRTASSGGEAAGCDAVSSVFGGFPQSDAWAVSRWVSVEADSGVRSGIRNPQLVQKRAVGRISFPQFGHVSINLLPCEGRQPLPPQFSRTADTRSYRSLPATAPVSSLPPVQPNVQPNCGSYQTGPAFGSCRKTGVEVAMAPYGYREGLRFGTAITPKEYSHLWR